MVDIVLVPKPRVILMYLYMFTDGGGVLQSTLPPNDSEKQMICDDELRVFCVESGNFQEIAVANANLVWQNVEDRQ